MKGRLAKVAGIVLAAIGSVIAWLLVWGASAAAAARHPLPMDRAPVDRGPTTTAEWLAIAAVAVVVTVALLLYVWSQRRTSVAQVRRLAIQHEREQKRKAA